MEPHEVLVVGGGPAGLAAAASLARRGLRTVLADRQDGPDPGHDIVVSGPALRALAEIDGWRPPELRLVETLDLRFGTGRSRRMATAGGICDRGRLLLQLRRVAQESGAELLRGEVRELRTDGDGHRAVVKGASGHRTLSACHVIIAAGSATGTALVPDRAPHAAGVIAAQRFTGIDLAPGMLLAFPSPEGTGPHESPTCVWVLPGANGTCTIGIARFGRPVPDAPGPLLETALTILAATEPAFTTARPAGPVAGGRVSGGFAPGHAVPGGRLLAGDAAGLINPFTGEGLSYAIQSGLLAAQAIAAHPTSPDAVRRLFVQRLSTSFVGYFETARHAARRYHLAWRVLAATVDSDHPFFAKGRRAILTPEGIAGLAADERLDLPAGEAALLKLFLTACDEIAVATVRREWPFIARMMINGAGPTHRRLRPAAAFFAALLAGGRPPEIGYAAVGTAIELASLGALAFLGPPAPPPRGRGVDWVSATTVLAGDFLLAQASRLVAAAAPQASWAFSEWLGSLAALRAARLTGGCGAAGLFAAMLEFPARIGAELGGAPPEVVDTVRAFGHHCGRALIHAEDSLALRGKPTRLDTALTAMLDGRISAVPDLMRPRPVTTRLLKADPDLLTAALTATISAGRQARHAAAEAATAVPDAVSAGILRAFVDAVAAPLTPQQSSL